MVKIYAKDRDGTVHEVAAEPGGSLMEVLREVYELGIDGTCGGCASCATCHVYIDGDWNNRLGGRNDDEEVLLGAIDHVTERSRLSCQVVLTEACDGLEIEVAPEQ